jgi:uncharacterized membrane protein
MLLLGSAEEDARSVTMKDDDDDRSIARGNAFARAVRPDDEKATSPIMYVVVGLLSLVLAAVFVAALVLPPLFTHTLIIRGLRTGRVGMLLLGVVMALIYLLLLWSVGKRLMGRPRNDDQSDR